jgi:hypothetical protein
VRERKQVTSPWHSTPPPPYSGLYSWAVIKSAQVAGVGFTHCPVPSTSRGSTSKLAPQPAWCRVQG